MKNFKIGTRLAMGFILVVMLIVANCATGVWRLQEVSHETHEIIDNALLKERLVSDWLRLTNANGVRALAFVKTDDKDVQAFFKNDMKKTSAKISTIQKQIKTLKSEPDEQKLFDIVGEKRAAYKGGRSKILEIKELGNTEEAAHLVERKMVPALNAYVKSVENVLAYQNEHINDEAARIYNGFATGRIVILSLGGAAVFISLIAAFILTRGITKPLEEAVMVAEKVAGGDLTVKVNVNSTDETGQLMRSLKGMTESLFETVSKVRAGTDTISTASSEIASGNMDLSSRTEQQASSLEETASSMEELTSTVRQNADNARQANQLAVTASGIAAKGGEVVSEVVATMSDINESSKKMADIIGVIDGIAFQTNILALNAAVEAARAGEQGRGFAVVATEVRSLAQRSAAAAREIKELIDTSVEKVTIGTELVATAGSTMDEVVSSIQRVHDIMGEITAASQEQSEGIEQVNQAIVQMDQVTQQNAALVEEAAAAAESLQDQSANLNNLVSVFNVGTASASASVAPRRNMPTRALPSHSAPKKMTPAVRTAAKHNVNNDDWEEF